MKSFVNYLEESLNRPYKWRQPIRTPRAWRATFTTDDGAKYDFLAVLVTRTERWGITFALIDPPDGSGETMALTGTEGGKGALRVFATIKEMVEAFLKDVDPARFEFAADKTERDDVRASRAKLYARFAKQLAKSHGYTMNTKDHGSDIAFRFVKEGVAP
jgi:hypothetical protein